MDLAGGLNQVLKMSSCKEIAQVDEFAVGFILNVDYTPAVLTAPNLLSVNDDRLFASDNGKWNYVLGSK